MATLYSIAVHFVYLLAIPASLFNKKVRLWLTGRIHWRKRLRQWQPKGRPVLWFHAASLGEFEQGRPLMEACKDQFSECELIVTFYSPSGYEVRKNYPKADYVCYLPLDTRYNAREFIHAVNPDVAFFIKYEFWYFYLRELRRRNIPVYLISGIFRSKQLFFRWYGQWSRRKLSYFSHFFVQDDMSSHLLRSIGLSHVTISGDTRFDRVTAIVNSARTIPVAQAFATGHFCLVAGSTWPPDEELLIDFIRKGDPSVRYIIAPHEIDAVHITKLTSRLQKRCIRYSLATTQNVGDKQVLIIDNVGMLSSLYQYGQLAYIGGGFGKGIHNILEAAVYGMPVIIGPNYHKFREAIEMISAGGAFPIASLRDLNKVLNNLISNNDLRMKASAHAKDYIARNTGATKCILQQISVDINI